MIQAAIRLPGFNTAYEELEREQNAVAEARERAKIGDAMYDAIERWRKLCTPMKQYAAVYRKREQIYWDILEFEDVTSDDVKMSSIRVEALTPKKKRECDDIGEFLVWEKEIRLKPDDILVLHELPEPIDMYDVATYTKLLTVCIGWASRLNL